MEFIQNNSTVGSWYPLWGAVIAPPGFLKSPALKEALAPIQRLENLLGKSFDEAEKGRSVETLTLQSHIKGIESQIADRFKGKKIKGKGGLTIESLKSQ